MLPVDLPTPGDRNAAATVVAATAEIALKPQTWAVILSIPGVCERDADGEEHQIIVSHLSLFEQHGGMTLPYPERLLQAFMRRN